VALGNLSAYTTLARRAASRLGTSSNNIVRAILAQWTCEQPGAWPPVHNNPGFVTVGALSSVGISAAYATSSPGAGFLAQFGSPEAGADAYAGLLSRGARYAAVRTAARVGDGEGFLRAVTSAGYGTRLSCCLSAYKALGGAVSGTGSTPDASPVSEKVPIRTLPFRPIFLQMVNAGVTAATVVTAALVGQYVLFEIETLGAGTPLGGTADAWETALTAAASKYIGQKVGALPDTIQVALPDVPPGALDNPASIAGTIISGLGDALRNTAILVGLIVLAILGLYLLVTSRE